jgi:hypothetical protein
MLLYQSPQGTSASLGVVLLELLDHQRVDQRGFLSPFLSPASGNAFHCRTSTVVPAARPR